MYQEKQSRYNKKRTNKRKAAVLLTSLVLVLVCAVGATVAYLVDTTSEVVNTFDPAQVSCRVDEESFDGTTKTNVTIANTSDIEAYIRAAVIVTWKDKDGNVYGKMPVKGQKTGEGDYTIELNLKDEADNVIWIEGSDGYYYYIRPVAVGASTATLITSCIDNGTAPAGYGLNVEILGSAIQAKGMGVTSAQDAWAKAAATG